MNDSNQDKDSLNLDEFFDVFSSDENSKKENFILSNKTLSCIEKDEKENSKIITSTNLITNNTIKSNIHYEYSFDSNISDSNLIFDQNLGINILSIKNTDNLYKYNLSCIYLISIGYVKNLRELFNIDSKFNGDDILCKYGLTKNLSRRIIEHENDYGKITGSHLYLKYYTVINIQKLFLAETILKNSFLRLGYKFDNCDGRAELVIIPKNDIDTVEKEYERINLFFRHNEYIFI